MIIKNISRAPICRTRWEHGALYNNTNNTHSHTHTHTHTCTHTHARTHTHISQRTDPTQSPQTYITKNRCHTLATSTTHKQQVPQSPQVQPTNNRSHSRHKHNPQTTGPTVATNTTHKQQVPQSPQAQPTNNWCHTVTINKTEEEEVLHSHKEVTTNTVLTKKCSCCDKHNLHRTGTTHSPQTQRAENRCQHTHHKHSSQRTGATQLSQTQLIKNRCHTVVTNTTHKEQVPHSRHKHNS